MAPIDDDPFAPAKKPAVHEIGEPLDAISVAELEERIDALKTEIERLSDAINAKRSSLAAAEDVFKT